MSAATSADPSQPVASHVFETAIGWFGLAWRGETIIASSLPARDRAATARNLARTLGGLVTGGKAREAGDGDLPPAIAALVARIRAYADGAEDDFCDVPVALEEVGAFRRAIYQAARRLAHGEATTYGELAASAGHPGMARETGAALGANPIPLIVPCHRILAAGGRIGGFSAPGGIDSKRRLLALERARLGKPDAAQASFGF